MVRFCQNASLRKLLCKRFGIVPGATVYNPRLSSVVFFDPINDQLLELGGLLDDDVAEVFTIKRLGEHDRVTKLQLFHDVIDCCLVGGCGKGNNRDIREIITKLAESGILNEFDVSPKN